MRFLFVVRHERAIFAARSCFSGKGRPMPSKGAQTRSDILDAAVDVASANGLEGLTIGSLADHVGLSKSGLYAHFGSKVDLQLATVGRAADVFAESMVHPWSHAEPGLAVLAESWEAWCDSVENSSYRGGCFFFAVSAEFDDRPGPVRTLVAELTGLWLTHLETLTSAALERRELHKSTDSRLLAFECHALVQEANWARRLLDRADSFTLARMGMQRRVRDACTKKGRDALAKLRSWKGVL